MNARACLWFIRGQLLVAAIGQAAASAQTATNPVPARPSAVVIPAQGPIQWKLTVDTFERTLKAACGQKPERIVFHVNSPGGVVDYTWNMISQIKSMPQHQTVAWINGEDNGVFSSGAIFVLACDKIYIAQGQAIGAAVPYALDGNGIPRDVSLKWRSAWHAQVRALCEMKHRPWPVVYALLSTGAGLYRIKTPTGYEYANYDRIRPMLKPELVTQMDTIVKANVEETESSLSGKAHVTIRESVSFTEGMPSHVEVICSVGDVLTLTAKEAVDCGLCDGIADSLEQVLETVSVPVDSRPSILADPFKQANKQMDGIVKTFLASMKAVGGTIEAAGPKVRARHQRIHFSNETMSDARLLTEYRKIRSLIDRYPDLITSQETLAEINSAITRIQANMQQQKEAQKEATKQERKYNRPPLIMRDRP